MNFCSTIIPNNFGNKHVYSNFYLYSCTRALFNIYLNKTWIEPYKCDGLNTIYEYIYMFIIENPTNQLAS